MVFDVMFSIILDLEKLKNNLHVPYVIQGQGTK